jgi:hypothetical protein
VEACADLGGVAWWSRDCACVDHQLDDEMVIKGKTEELLVK